MGIPIILHLYNSICHRIILTCLLLLFFSTNIDLYIVNYYDNSACNDCLHVPCVPTTPCVIYLAVVSLLQPYLLVSVSVASAKKILVHGPDLSSIPSQLPIHEV